MSKKPYVVVAGTDFSDEAVRSLRVACRQAVQNAPAELHVVHVCIAVNPEPSVPMAPLAGLAVLPVLSLEEQRQALTKHLDAELAKLPEVAGAGVRVFGHVVIDTPSFGLTRLASELEADLIVIGTHGLHGIARWLLGSVARASCAKPSVPSSSCRLSQASLRSLPSNRRVRAAWWQERLPRAQRCGASSTANATAAVTPSIKLTGAPPKPTCR